MGYKKSRLYIWAGTSILSESPWRELEVLQGRGNVRDTQIAGSHTSGLVHSCMSRDGQGLDKIRLPIANGFASPRCPREYQIEAQSPDTYRTRAADTGKFIHLTHAQSTCMFDTCAGHFCGVWIQTLMTVSLALLPSYNHSWLPYKRWVHAHDNHAGVTIHHDRGWVFLSIMWNWSSNPDVFYSQC